MATALRLLARTHSGSQKNDCLKYYISFESSQLRFPLTIFQAFHGCVYKYIWGHTKPWVQVIQLQNRLCGSLGVPNLLRYYHVAQLTKITLYHTIKSGLLQPSCISILVLGLTCVCDLVTNNGLKTFAALQEQVQFPPREYFCHLHIAPFLSDNMHTLTAY